MTGRPCFGVDTRPDLAHATQTHLGMLGIHAVQVYAVVTCCVVLQPNLGEHWRPPCATPPRPERTRSKRGPPRCALPRPGLKPACARHGMASRRRDRPGVGLTSRSQPIVSAAALLCRHRRPVCGDARAGRAAGRRPGPALHVRGLWDKRQQLRRQRHQGASFLAGPE